MLLVLVCLLAAHAAAVVESPLRCRDESCQYLGMFHNYEHRYMVDGNELGITYRGNKGYFWINCITPTVTESTAIPRAVNKLFAWQVGMTNCKPPANSSIVNKLNWLNITMLFNDTDEISTNSELVLNNLPPSSLLTENHFFGLESLFKLEISVANGRANTENNFLVPLKSLRQLKIQNVKVTENDLNTPIPTLQELTLIQTGLTKLSEAIYKSSSILNLTVDSDVPFDAVVVPPKLKWLELKSPATTLKLESVLALETLYIANWMEMEPEPFASCENLHELHLTSPAVRTLPYHWVARCTMLEKLVIGKALNLTTLPRRLFGTPVLGETGINHIAFKDGVLETLNQGQFDLPGGKTSYIDSLELNGNRLREIPIGTIPSRVFGLDLSSNDLDNRVLVAVRRATSLKYLNLSNNPRISDVCDEDEYSPLHSMDILRNLSLANTAVTRVCRDWRQSMLYLQSLDLRNTSVSELKLKDLMFLRNVWSEVLLQGAPISRLKMTRDDFEIAKRLPYSDASVIFDNSSRFQCDCHMYWTRRVLESSPHVLKRVSELRCSDEELLKDKMVEDQACERLEECAAVGLPKTCTCSERPNDDPAQDRQLLRVDCTGAALLHVPPLPTANNRLYELLLADNQITTVHANDLDNVKTLDLRNNFITKADKETGRRLGSIGGMLRLAGNRLECDCSAAPLLQALRGRAPERADLARVYCSDDTPLSEAPIADCPPSIAGVVASLVVLSAFAVAVTVCLASRERRFFAKAVLHRWGCLCCLDVDEDDRRYDAFVTFSHKDEDIVYELMARLEPPYRLCVHHRDWIPGLQIPDQIVNSVRESRRTLALVSRHFLASSWTRAEFREAHEAAMLDARPRLVVILLEDPAALALDEQLQRYIATHTYLRWGDPWFYHKLMVALPRPRRPPSVTTPAPLLPITLRSAEEATIPLSAMEIL